VINKNIIKTISDKEMDRKDFLKYSGIALLGLVGLKTIISVLTQPDNHNVNTVNSHKDVKNGFGGGKYGA